VDEQDYIYREGDHSDEMYFLVRGEVGVGFIRSDEFVPYMVVDEGYYFGELDLMFSETQKHMDCTRTHKKCELLTLSRPNFQTMLEDFEEEALEIAALAKDRFDRNLVLRKQAERDYALQLKVVRHRSIPVNVNMKNKNPLWILNQL
jgi:CRP-like cAMP-binding protein